MREREERSHPETEREVQSANKRDVILYHRIDVTRAARKTTTRSGKRIPNSIILDRECGCPAPQLQGYSHISLDGPPSEVTVTVIIGIISSFIRTSGLKPDGGCAESHTRITFIIVVILKTSRTP